MKPNKVKKPRLKIILAILLTFSSMLVLPPGPAHAAYPYASPPRDVESIKSKIADSLVLVKYGASPQLAFSATYDITQSLKDQGTYSILVTPEAPISNCFRTPYDLRRLGLNLEYKGKSYKGTCYGWGIDYVDMASIHTTVAIPQLSLWDSYWPQIGGWLIAVYYLPNYGITFQETRVGIVDKSKYVLGIEKFASPPPDGLALIFNQDSSFVGVMTNKTYGNVPSQYFKVHGAPLQCDLQGNDGNSLTRCNGTRKSVNESAQAGVWTIDSVNSPTSTPKPTPTPSPTDLSKEGKEAYDFAVDTYNQFKKSKLICLDSFRAKNSAEQKILTLVNVNAICSSQDGRVESVYRSLTSLRLTATSSSVSRSTIDQINRINEDFQDAIDVNSIGSSFGDALLTSAQEYVDLRTFFASFDSATKSIDKVLAKFPTKIRTALRNSDAFFEFREFQEEISNLRVDMESIESDLANFVTPDSSYESTIEDLEELTRVMPRTSIVDRAIKRAQDSIPAFYCKKGATAALPKNSKCSSGYVRVNVPR